MNLVIDFSSYEGITPSNFSAIYDSMMYFHTLYVKGNHKRNPVFLPADEVKTKTLEKMLKTHPEITVNDALKLYRVLFGND